MVARALLRHTHPWTLIRVQRPACARVTGRSSACSALPARVSPYNVSASIVHYALLRVSPPSPVWPDHRRCVLPPYLTLPDAVATVLSPLPAPPWPQPPPSNGALFSSRARPHRPLQSGWMCPVPAVSPTVVRTVGCARPPPPYPSMDAHPRAAPCLRACHHLTSPSALSTTRSYACPPCQPVPLPGCRDHICVSSRPV